MKKLLLLFTASILIVACGATYPSACKLDNSDGTRTWSCRCSEVKVSIGTHPDGPAPRGVVSWKCDGKALPIEVLAEDVGLPKCQN